MDTPRENVLPECSELIKKLYNNLSELTHDELKTLLTAQGELQSQLHACARAVRKSYVGDKLIRRGVIELSNICKKDCDYCAMRRSNCALTRYTMTTSQVMSVVDEIAQAGIGIVFLQSGQDATCDTVIKQVIPQIKKNYDVSVLLCCGEKSADTYREFKSLGADSYIIKYEMSRPELYESITHSPLAPRIKCMREIRDAGMKIGTGNIVGVPGQTLDDLIADIRFTFEFSPDFSSSAPFVPNAGTPLEGCPRGNADLALNIMAIWRVAMKNILIPSISALELIEPGEGQLRGANAGANVMTVNFTPSSERDKYAIYSDKRYVVSLRQTQSVAQRAGLTL